MLVDDPAVKIDGATEAQRDAVQTSLDNFWSSEVAVVSVKIINPAEFLREGEKAEGLYIEFQYREKCPGHPCEDAAADHPHAGIGETFDCDGTCRTPGREVHVYAEDGEVLDSQDFG